MSEHDDEAFEERLKRILVDNGHGAKLSLEALAAMQPGLARLMPEVGTRTWKTWYAAQARNWPLARFQLKEARKLLELCGTNRPKYEKDLRAYVERDVKLMMEALEAEDFERFDREFRRAIEHANRYHADYGKGFLVWKLPDHPPPDLDLEPRPAAPKK